MENPQSIEYKLHCCKIARTIAATTLHRALSELLDSRKPISEVNLRDRWLKKMRNEGAIFPDGWYCPPPSGITVLFGTEKNHRIDYNSLRSKSMWPRKDQYLNRKNGLIYAFASPVHKKTGIIGDFGVTLYFGKNQQVQKLLKTTLQINKRIQKGIKPGQAFSKIFTLAKKEIRKVGLENKITSTTDPASTNIGHTVPASYEKWTEEQTKSLRTKKMSSIISSSRRFINAIEVLQVKRGMAMTIEPRLKPLRHQNLPIVSLHTIGLIHPDGRVELLENFHELFQLAGMEYMLDN